MAAGQGHHVSQGPPYFTFKQSDGSIKASAAEWSEKQQSCDIVKRYNVTTRQRIAARIGSGCLARATVLADLLSRPYTASSHLHHGAAPLGSRSSPLARHPCQFRFLTSSPPLTVVRVAEGRFQALRSDQLRHRKGQAADVTASFFLVAQLQGDGEPVLGL
jgi:hypothetical protein